MNTKNTTSILLAGFLILAFSHCASDDYLPKPRGYFRISFPPKNYQNFDSVYPFRFRYPVYARVQVHTQSPQGEHWLNLQFPQQQAYIHLTYKHIDADIDKYLEDAYTLAYKHTVRADAIREQAFANDSVRSYGLLYQIKGNAASSVQFFLTDSSEHFLRGALYFNTRPNKDSLAPVIDFLQADIVHLVESLQWK